MRAQLLVDLVQRSGRVLRHGGFQHTRLPALERSRDVRLGRVASSPSGPQAPPEHPAHEPGPERPGGRADPVGRDEATVGGGVKALREPRVEGHLHEAGGGPDDEHERQARPAHPRGQAGRRSPDDPPCGGELHRHGGAHDPGDAPHVGRLKLFVVGRPDVAEERVVNALDNEDHPEHDQGGRGVEGKEDHDRGLSPCGPPRRHRRRPGPRRGRRSATRCGDGRRTYTARDVGVPTARGGRGTAGPAREGRRKVLRLEMGPAARLQPEPVDQLGPDRPLECRLVLRGRAHHHDGYESTVVRRVAGGHVRRHGEVVDGADALAVEGEKRIVERRLRGVVVEADGRAALGWGHVAQEPIRLRRLRRDHHVRRLYGIAGRERYGLLVDCLNACVQANGLVWQVAAHLCWNLVDAAGGQHRPALREHLEDELEHTA